MLIIKLKTLLYLNIALRIFNDNYYITEYIKKVSPPKGETDNLQEPMEEEIAETEISLDEKEEETEGQKKDLPSNESNSLTITLYNMKQHPWLNEKQKKLPNTFPTVICDDLYYLMNLMILIYLCLQLIFMVIKSMFYVIATLLNLFIILLKIIMREENMVVEVLMLLKPLSFC